mmetsp:Transcript_91876/g.285890  ORF Transcript_91876/g.285890 Transcript_91876/m.285890 type:complete len:213 (+) Transcript_91876:906-1544(+)
MQAELLHLLVADELHARKHRVPLPVRKLDHLHGNGEVWCCPLEPQADVAKVCRHNLAHSVKVSSPKKAAADSHEPSRCHMVHFRAIEQPQCWACRHPAVGHARRPELLHRGGHLVLGRPCSCQGSADDQRRRAQSSQKEDDSAVVAPPHRVKCVARFPGRLRWRRFGSGGLRCKIKLHRNLLLRAGRSVPCPQWGHGGSRAARGTGTESSVP